MIDQSNSNRNQNLLRWNTFSLYTKQHEHITQEKLLYLGNVSDICGWYAEHFFRSEQIPLTKLQCCFMIELLLCMKIYYLHECALMDETQSLQPLIQSLTEQYQIYCQCTEKEIMSSDIMECAVRNHPLFKEAPARKQILVIMHKLSFKGDHGQRLRALLKEVLLYFHKMVVERVEVDHSTALLLYLNTFMMLVNHYPTFQHLALSNIEITHCHLSHLLKRQGSVHLMRSIVRTPTKQIIGEQQQIQQFLL